MPGSSLCDQVVLVQVFRSVEVNLIEDHDGLLIGAVDFRKDLVHRIDMVLKARMRNIHHMQQQVGLPDLDRPGAPEIEKLRHRSVETTDLAAERTDVVAALRAEYAVFADELTRRGDLVAQGIAATGEPGAIDEETREQLEALGYLD